MKEYIEIIANQKEYELRRENARKLCRELNNLDESKEIIYRKLFCKAGCSLEIWNNFFCEFGDNISFGNNVFVNVNNVFLDTFSIDIGDNVAIGPNVGIYTTNHSLDRWKRRKYIEYGAGVTVGDDVWIGGNVVLLPGVTIGSGSVIAAGSIIAKDVPCGTMVKGKMQNTLHKLQGTFEVE